MISLQLPRELLQLLTDELVRAGTREIGGVVAGEHLGGDVFRVLDISVQRAGGTTNGFTRNLQHSRRFLNQFFRKTGHDYARYNYLGEWHSHPLFDAHPSTTDFQQMQEIVETGEDRPLFAVLIIVRLKPPAQLELSACAFRPGAPIANVDVVVIDYPPLKNNKSWWARLRDFRFSWSA
ncbi:MAG: Mov34/MPN/PAD-1 family protein [Nitrospiraceae bacterium]